MTRRDSSKLLKKEQTKKYMKSMTRAEYLSMKHPGWLPIYIGKSTEESAKKKREYYAWLKELVDSEGNTVQSSTPKAKVV